MKGRRRQGESYCYKQRKHQAQRGHPTTPPPQKCTQDILCSGSGRNITFEVLENVLSG